MQGALSESECDTFQMTPTLWQIQGAMSKQVRCFPVLCIYQIFQKISLKN